MKAIQKQNTDPKVVMMQTMQKTPRVGSNGGTAAGLVGSYDEVAERIEAFHAPASSSSCCNFSRSRPRCGDLHSR